MARDMKLCDIERIIESYNKFDGSAYRVEKELGYNPKTILKYWRQMDFKMRKLWDRVLSDQKIEEIISSYNKFHGNAKQTGKFFGISTPTIIKYWNLEGLKAVGKRIKKRDYRGYSSPLEYFENNYSANVKEKIKKNGRWRFMKENPTLCTALYRWGQIEDVIPKDNTLGRHNLPLCKIEKIIYIYPKSNGSAKRASRILFEEGLSISPPTIFKYWKEMGFETNKRGRPRKEQKH